MPSVWDGQILVWVISGRPEREIAGELRNHEEYRAFVESLGSTFIYGGQYSLRSISKDLTPIETQNSN